MDNFDQQFNLESERINVNCIIFIIAPSFILPNFYLTQKFKITSDKAERPFSSSFFFEVSLFIKLTFSVFNTSLFSPLVHDLSPLVVDDESDRSGRAAIDWQPLVTAPFG